MKYSLLSGEKFQKLCDIYIGEQYDFDYNPIIKDDISKHVIVKNIKEKFYNPKYIFVYTHRLESFSKILKYFTNPFILISHNSDENITDKYKIILNEPLLIHWYSQNILVNNNLKLSLLPIGIANSMWEHGNMSIIENNLFKNNKSLLIYFNFTVETNTSKRLECKTILEEKGIFMTPSLKFNEYIQLLSASKYSICPEGGGIDSHRIWESLYCGTIPIMLRNNFSEILAEEYPCVLLDTWDELSLENVMILFNENPFTDEVKYKLSFEYFKDLIINMYKHTT